MISEHFDALQTRIEAGTGLADKVSDTVRQGVDGLVRDQYVILYRSAPRFSVDRLAKVADMSSILEFDIPVRAVGTSPSKALKTLDRVLGQLVGYSLVVAGRRCSPMTVEDVGDVETDTSVKEFLYYVDVSLGLVSEPA